MQKESPALAGRFEDLLAVGANVVHEGAVAVGAAGEQHSATLGGIHATLLAPAAVLKAFLAFVVV